MKTSEPRSLKIGLVFDDSLDSNDGVAQYVKRVGSWLEKQGHEVSYLVGESQIPTWRGGRVYSLSKNLPVRWGGNRLSISIFSKAVDINRVLDKKQFDVLHVQFPYSPFMAQRVINRVGGRTAVVGTAHVPSVNVVSDLGSKLLRLIYGRSLRRFDSFVSVSLAAQAYAKKNFAVESSLVPNTVDIAKFKSPKPKSAGKARIVFLGRLTERKGCKYLIKAFRLLANHRDDIDLVIAGDGPQRQQLEKFVERCGLSERVSFLGLIAEEEKPRLLASADIACFPSLYGESFGIVLIEAMAAGAGVVIGGNNPGYSGVLGEQPKLLINPRNTSEFFARLAELLDNKSEAKKLHQWQQEEVKQYDVDVVGKKLLAVYYQAIALARKSRHN